MPEKNFSKEPVVCPDCDGIYMVETKTHEWSPSGGMITRKGPLVCVSCSRTVDLSVALGRLQMKQKQAEMERLQEEIDAAHQAYGVAEVENADVPS
jgi:hypothetical protein